MDTYKKGVPLLVLLVCNIFTVVSPCGFLSKRFVVHIVNHVSTQESISVHCNSPDHDIGTHTVLPNDDFNFSFCTRFLGTYWYCDIARVDAPGLHVKIEAFTPKFNGQYLCGKSSRQCYWAVNPDGIFFGKDLQKMEKKYDWPLNHTLSTVDKKLEKKKYSLSRGPFEIGL
ncbi:self-incompatibility protein S1-like [Andrographis paniculata]|uniref:self-incompatibility protein S1-like n=1 Tax=Andrographis paniculata TaxID=175694 RepID=UPI0021E8562A|nr:self-incompatibility protein S1-like [Andrographis paniculata]